MLTDGEKYGKTTDDPVFLKTRRDTFNYSHLYGFTLWLRKNLKNRSIMPGDHRPILVFPDQSDEVIFLIAASFLLKIPLMVLHPETEKQEVVRILEMIEPAAHFRGTHLLPELSKNIPQLRFGKQQINIHSDNQDKISEIKYSGNIAGYFTTSGSTGAPKVVPITYEQIHIAADSSAKNLKPDPNRFWLLCMPLNHIGGMSVIYRSIIYGSAIYNAERFEPKEIRSLLNENRNFEAASMVPTMLNVLLKDSFFRVQFGFKGLLLGGGPISIELIELALTRGIPLVTSYGMTETCAQIAANPMLRSGMYIPKTSVGPVFRPNEVEIRDENGQKMIDNESGFIWLKGPQVFKGYLDKSQNRNVFDDEGWFNTGDYGRMNRKGHLFIETRRSDLILTGGENVNPTEIETILNRYSSIAESVVIGIPDTKWGQRVIAFIQPAADQRPDFDQIKKELKEKVRDFKIPKEFILIDRIPKTDTLKIKRNKLKQIYMNGFSF